MAKTTTRQPALTWFDNKFPEVKDNVFTTKSSIPSLSLGDSRVWFFQIPLAVIEPNKIKHLHLVCQNHLDPEQFLYFKVPTLFLLRNQQYFEVDLKTKVLRLYISAEASDLYKEIRKGSRLDFGVYLQEQ